MPRKGTAFASESISGVEKPALRLQSVKAVSMVGVVQLVERRIVAPVVAGSNPVAHPKFRCGVISQEVRQEVVALSCVGSIPT